MSDLDDADPPVDGIDFDEENHRDDDLGPSPPNSDEEGPPGDEGANKCDSAITRDDTNMSLNLIQALEERIPRNTLGDLITNGGDCRCRSGCAILLENAKVHDFISLIFRL